MKVVAKTVWKAVKPGEVYPRDFGPGDEIPEWAEPAAAVAAGAAERVSGSEAEPDDAAAPAATADNATATRVVARVTSDCALKVEGRTTRFKAGKTVYDEVARMLVELGNAVEIRADEGAPETK